MSIDTFFHKNLRRSGRACKAPVRLSFVEDAFTGASSSDVRRDECIKKMMGRCSGSATFHEIIFRKNILILGLKRFIIILMLEGAQWGCGNSGRFHDKPSCHSREAVRKEVAVMLKKILYPTDFSDVAEKALEYVEALKEAGAKEVVVLHVFDSRTLDYLNRYVSTYADGMKITEENKKSTVKLMQEIEQRLEKRGFVATSRLAEGVPAFEIMKVAEEEKVSVVVIGSHGMSNVKEMLLGSVSETVIRKSKMPVVVVKR